MRRDVVVGTDGSPSGTAAVQWAAHEAARQQSDLWVVHVVARHANSQVVAAARRVLNQAATTARATAPAVRVMAELRTGDVALELLEEAADASVLVLGSRGHGGVVGLVVGSVCQKVAGRTTGAVVVVRDLPDADKGEIVVGFDGSEASRRAVAFAFEQANRRHARLHMVSAWMAPVVTGFDVGWIDTDESLRTSKEFVGAELAAWRDKFPAVEADASVRIGYAASVLCDTSSTADLVIVGSRGRGAVRSTFLGSVGNDVLVHAACPVGIVGPDSRRAEVG